MRSKKNSYVVKIGRKPGLYYTWDDCSKQVTGFSGAVFKGFVIDSEAEAYMKQPVKLPHVTTPSRKGHYRMSGRPRPPGSNTTNPRNLAQFYSGVHAPWDYPTFMECYE